MSKFCFDGSEQNHMKGGQEKEKKKKEKRQ